MDFEGLQEIIADVLGIDPDQITPESNLADDLDADSLDAMQIVMAIEEKCGKNIPDEKIPEIKTVEDILNYLEA